jgi:hypothetical protein
MSLSHDINNCPSVYLGTPVTDQGLSLHSMRNLISGQLHPLPFLPLRILSANFDFRRSRMQSPQV